MPDLSPTMKMLQGATCIPDSGLLKQGDGQYNMLQNIRGWGGLTAKRKGIRPITSYTGGIMGFMDLYIPGEPGTVDKIAVFTRTGSMFLLDPTELTTTVDYLQAANVKLYLQSPDLTWWDFGLTSGGLLNPTGVTYTGTTITADQLIRATEVYGFAFTGLTQTISIDQDSQIWVKELVAVSGLTSYSSTRAFTTGHGLVFEASDLSQRRLTVDNTGTLTVTEL